METAIKEVTAEVYLSVDVDCPECESSIDIREKVNEAEAWLPNQLSIPKCEIEVKCPDCKTLFLVTQVDY